jgi:hypothetical protein
MSSDTVRKAVRGVVNWVSNMRIEEIATPSPVSPAGKAEAACDGFRRERLEQARFLAAARLLNARSCLDAIHSCFELRDPAPSIHTLSRTVVENSARAHWLCDPDIDANERIARSAADELHGLDEYRKLGQRSDPTWEPTYRARREEFRAELISAQVEPAERPTATAISTQLLGGGAPQVEIMYRLFSITPHGSSHSLLAPLRQTGIYVEPARIAALGLMLAFDDFTKYLGWGGRPAFRQFAARTHRSFGVPDESYWQSND